MDTKTFLKVLEAEKEKLEVELLRLGERDVANPNHWVLKPSTLDIMESDLNEVADRVEDTNIDQIVLDELDMRYRLVLHALGKIGLGTYGFCEVEHAPIEEDRLGANPAARTCKAHMGQENTLTL